MPQSHFAHHSDLMLRVLLANRPHKKRQLQLDYRFLFRRLVASVAATRTVEVGAFEAGFSQWWMKGNPASSAIAYEANPYVAELYGPENRALGVDYRHACVADTKGEVTLDIPRDYRGGERDRVNQMSSLLSNLSTEQTEKVNVPSVRLDDDIALAEDDRIVMWIDVEGALGRVLPHMTTVLAKTALVNIEVESTPIWDGQWLDTDTADFFAEQGFVFLARDFQRPYQYNCIFANPALVDLATLRGLLARFHSGPFPQIAQALDARATMNKDAT